MAPRHPTTLLAGALLLAPFAARAQPADDAGSVESVIVTGERLPRDPPVVAEARERLSRTPGAVSVVPSESYETRTTRGLADLLRDVPGLLAQERYGEEAKIAIRGSGADQSAPQRGVLLAQDSVPLADADGLSDSEKIDPLTARYVEVYRGGGALRLGGARLGGAINLVTPTGRTARSRNLLRLEGGSFGTARAAAQIARSSERWDAYGALTGLTSEGAREHAAQEQVRATLNLGRAFGEDREARLILYAADLDQQVSGAVTLDGALTEPQRSGLDAAATSSARDQSLWRATLQTRWRLGPSSVLEGGVYATGRDLRRPASLLIEQQTSTRGAFARIDWEGELAARPADLYWGFSHRRGTNDQTLGPVLFAVAGDALQKATGLDLFAEGRWFLTDRLALVAGGSYGVATRDYADRLDPANDGSADFDWLAPRIGLLWEADEGVQIYANLTKSTEPPHYGALVQAPFADFAPVQPQEAWTAEIGSRGRLGPILWDVTLFRAELEGELLSFNDAYGLPPTLANAEDTLHQGAEVALDWRISESLLGGALDLQVTYTYADSRFDDDPVLADNALPASPPQAGAAVLRYRRDGGWFIAPAVEWRPEDVYVDYANTLTAPGYTIWSLNTGWELDSGLALFLDARNLTDEAYATTLGAITDASAPGANTAVFHPGEPRAAYLGVRYRF